MNRVYVFDTTLRDGEQSPGASLNVEEKLDIARQLEKLGVDVIEAGFPISSPGDWRSVNEVSKVIQDATICGLTRAVEKDILVAAEALAPARRKRIHTGLGVSDVHLQYKLRLSREQAIEKGVAAVRLARGLADEVEYFLEDAGRADPDYICQVVEAVINAGATVINVPDTTGYAIPEEFGALIANITHRVPNVDKAVISVHCHNDLGLATANALAGIRNGARQVEVTINGIGERAGNTALEEVVMALKTRESLFGVTTGINTREITKTSRLVSNLTGILVQPNKAIVGANAFAHSSGIHQDGVLKERTTYEIIDPRDVGIQESRIILTARSGRHGVKHRLEELGFQLDADKFEDVYQRFLNVADKKKQVYDEDLEAIVADASSTVVQTWDLVQVQALCGNMVVPTSTVKLRHASGTETINSAIGTGPVDAAYSAINRVFNVDAELQEFSIQAVTEGIDAMAEVSVRVASQQGDVFSGRAAATDIVVASALAYVQALNKLMDQRSGVNRRGTGESAAGVSL